MGYTPKIWPYMVQYLHFRILEFPLIIAYMEYGMDFIINMGLSGLFRLPQHPLHHFIIIFPTKLP